MSGNPHLVLLVSRRILADVDSFKWLDAQRHGKTRLGSVAAGQIASASELQGEKTVPSPVKVQRIRVAFLRAPRIEPFKPSHAGRKRHRSF
ncbi:MAG: hypothetical protein CMJ81_07560 [Planctomycetaceae bacterium]|nr:hypothetical protein [Planctomycetaceae bacterium]